MEENRMTGVENRKLSEIGLIGIVAGSILGAGIFNFPQAFGQITGPYPLLIAWGVTAVGVLGLAGVYQGLYAICPDGSSIQTLQRKHLGFVWTSLATWSYWCSAWIGNLAYLVLIGAGLQVLFPVLQAAPPMVLCALVSLWLWCIHFRLLKGIQGLEWLSTVLTGLKLCMLLFFIFITGYLFSVDTFFNLDPQTVAPAVALLTFWEQVRRCLLTTTWVFIGFEGAILLSARTQDRRIVRKATYFGIILSFMVYLAVSMLPYGALSGSELALLKAPSMAGLMEKVLGNDAGKIVSAAIIFFSAGALLSWSMYAAEIPLVAAKDRLFPKWMGSTGSLEAPRRAIEITTIFLQFFLFVCYKLQINYQRITECAALAMVPTYLSATLTWLCILIARRKAMTPPPASGNPVSSTKEPIMPFLNCAAALGYLIWLIYSEGMVSILKLVLLTFPGLLMAVSMLRYEAR